MPEPVHLVRLPVADVSLNQPQLVYRDVYLVPAGVLALYEVALGVPYLEPLEAPENSDSEIDVYYVIPGPELAEGRDERRRGVLSPLRRAPLLLLPQYVPFGDYLDAGFGQYKPVRKIPRVRPKLLHSPFPEKGQELFELGLRLEYDVKLVSLVLRLVYLLDERVERGLVLLPRLYFRQPPVEPYRLPFGLPGFEHGERDVLIFRKPPAHFLTG